MTNAQYESNQDETIDDLDETLDDLADMPETSPWAAGSYLAKMFVKRNLGPDKKKKGAYIVEFVHQETIELSNPNEESSTKPGDKSAVFISTINKDGQKVELAQGTLKKLLKPIADLHGTIKIGEIIEHAKPGVDVAITVAIRKSKDPQYADQQDIKAIQLA